MGGFRTQQPESVAGIEAEYLILPQRFMARGAFQGDTADQAYFVRCGLDVTMTQAEIDEGKVIIEVGFAPLKPAEFVIIKIQQKVSRL